MSRFLFALSLMMLLLACSGSQPASEPEQVYQVRGIFLGMRFEGRAIRVHHEEIPGYMEAMRMDFKLKEGEQTQTLEPGDIIEFRYVLTKDGDAYVEGIEKLPAETPLNLPGDSEK